MLLKSLPALLALLMLTSIAAACPFCESATPPWLAQIAEADVAVVAKVTKVQAAPTGDNVVPLSQVHFEVAETLHGAKKLGSVKTFRIEMLETPAIGSQWFFTAMGAPQLGWLPVSELTPAREKYLAGARRLPAAGNERHQFFAAYLEHADEILAADAYGEFAATPFTAVQAFKPHLKREQLWRWIESEKTPEQRRGLYYTMLGVCGTPADAQRLEQLLTAPTKRPPGGFDALVACYLALRGEAGLKAVEAKLFKDKSASDADIEAAILALRFHGEEQHVLKRERIAAAYLTVLDRPALAALVIPDLARWQDWQSMDALVALFKSTDSESAWLRIPIVAYLRACPLPAAKQHLDALAKLDPEAIEQADALSLFGVKLRGTEKK